MAHARKLSRRLDTHRATADELAGEFLGLRNKARNDPDSPGLRRRQVTALAALGIELAAIRELEAGAGL